MSKKRKRRGPLPPFVGPLLPEPVLDYVILTDPGCSPGDPLWELHALEVQGAMMALHVRGPWEGGTLMDCGCILDLASLASLD